MNVFGEAFFMKTVPTKAIEILWQKYYITLEVLYYLSNFINTPNIFTNSTKARSKRFDTWFHRQVKFLVQVVAMGGSFSGRRSSCPDWPSWCLPGPLSHCLGHCTPLHTGLCSPLWKERETSCHLVIGGERGARGRTGEDYDAIIIKICEDEVWNLNIEMQITWWDKKKTFFIANIKCVSTIPALLLQIELFQSFPWSTSNLSNSLNALPVYHPQSPFVSTIWPSSGRPALPMVFIKSILKHKKVSWAVQTPKALLLQVVQTGNILIFVFFWIGLLS